MQPNSRQVFEISGKRGVVITVNLLSSVRRDFSFVNSLGMIMIWYPPQPTAGTEMGIGGEYIYNG